MLGPLQIAPPDPALADDPHYQRLLHAEAEAARWQVFGIEQTGQKKKSDGRTADVIEVVRSCEARDAASIRRITAPWYRRLLPG